MMTHFEFAVWILVIFTLIEINYFECQVMAAWLAKYIWEIHLTIKNKFSSMAITYFVGISEILQAPEI